MPPAASAGAHRHRPAARLAARSRTRRQPRTKPPTSCCCCAPNARSTSRSRPATRAPTKPISPAVAACRDRRRDHWRRPTLPARCRRLRPAREPRRRARTRRDADPVAGARCIRCSPCSPPPPARSRAPTGRSASTRPPGRSGLEARAWSLRTDVGYILSGHAAYPALPPGLPSVARGCIPTLRLHGRPLSLRRHARPAHRRLRRPGRGDHPRPPGDRLPAVRTAHPPVLLGCGEDGRLRPLLGAAAGSPTC